MERASLLLAGFLVVLPIQSFAAEDELCSRLRAFQAAQFDKDAESKPLRRAIEFHWIGYWLDFDKGFGTQCRDGSTAPGKALCAWLPQNTSVEFPEELPMNILRCYGWKIPGYASDWYVRTGSFEIDTDEHGNEQENSDRYLRLEINMEPRKPGHTAIRLSVIPWAEKYLDPQPRLKIDEPIDTKIEDLYP
jgi:hypothetical protein